MQSLKSRIFNFLTKRQKSDILKYISIYTGKNSQLSAQDILEKFMDDENSYLQTGSSRHAWLVDLIDNEDFQRDLLCIIKENLFKISQKEKNKIYTDKQKQYLKEQRAKQKEESLARSKPTEKQINYYKKLCKAKNIPENIINLEDASKLDLKIAISSLLEENKNNDKSRIMADLKKLLQKNKKF